MPSYKITFNAIIFATALLIAGAAFAQSATTTTAAPPPPPGGAMTGPMGGPPGGGNPAIRAAIQACAGSVAKDAQGHPDHEAMKACMTSKGFSPPQHGAGGPPPGGMPPANSGAHMSGPMQMAPGTTPPAAQ
jgi:hypothetical protein